MFTCDNNLNIIFVYIKCNTRTVINSIFVLKYNMAIHKLDNYINLKLIDY